MYGSGLKWQEGDSRVRKKMRYEEGKESQTESELAVYIGQGDREQV
jgi:hypothetical protein